MAELKLKELGKTLQARRRFEPVRVLSDINLHVRSGETLVIVGPSGAGKSMLLRMIAGLEDITEGSIEIDGVAINDLPPGERGVSMVFQAHALYPHMNVYDNMAFALSVARKSRAVIDEEVRKAARLLELEPLLERLPGELSEGQRQRVAIGRAIVRKPGVFLFDEPLSDLDATLRAAVRVELARLKQKLPEATMLFVTHDLAEAMTLADRIVVLADRKIVQVGPPLELYDRPINEFVARFIGTPAINLWAGRITGTGDETTVTLDEGGVVKVDLPTESGDEGKIVNLGIRPEHLTRAPRFDDTAIRGRVTHIEALGEVTLLHLQQDGRTDPVIAKLPGSQRISRGAEIRLQAAPEMVQLFHEGRSMRVSP